MEYRFNEKVKFMEKLRELFEGGHNPREMEIVMPNPDHEIEHLIEEYTPPSKLKFITLTGGLLGCITGYFFTNWTAIDWPLVTGGKPYFSWPAYTVIAFELTILLGALFSFAGFLLMGRVPKFSNMFSGEEYGNQYVIIIDDED